MFAADAGKKYWADKTPDYGPYLASLQRLGPDCRFNRIRDELKRIRPGSFLEVRFEDLIDAPGDTLRVVAGFLRLAGPDDWLAASAEQVQPERVQSLALADAISLLTGPQRRLLDELGYLRPSR